MALYEIIGDSYDRTRRADPYLTERLASLLRPEPCGIYLDVGCGTANYSTALAQRNVRCCGADVSPSMLRTARAKSREVEFVRGDVHRLPFADGAFSGAFCFLSIHHFRDLASGFGEIRRVLSGGRLILFTSTSDQMRGYWLNRYFPSAMEKSRLQMPSMERIASTLEEVGLNLTSYDPYFVRDDLQDRFLYSAKSQPHLYLDEQFRKGISTFRMFGEAEEVERGCRSLRDDLQSGRFATVAWEYDDSGGDYVFLTAEVR